MSRRLCRRTAAAGRGSFEVESAMLPAETAEAVPPNIMGLRPPRELSYARVYPTEPH